MPMLSFDLTKSKVIRAGKIAAALFAAYFAYFLWQTILSYATEPKVIGGLHLDQPLPQTTHWSPVWVPMILTALFAYGTWPRQIPQGPMRRFFRGSFALLRIELFALFISIFCPGLGGVYLLLPMLTAGELPSVLMQLVLSSAGTVVIMLMFHFVALIASSIVVGPTILFVTHFVSSRLPTTSLDDWPTTRDASRGFFAFDFAKATRLLPKILAVLIVGAIVVAGLKFAGLRLFIMWLIILFSAALPCLVAIGATIGWVGKDWTWCAAVSLPIGYYFSIDRGLPDGILISQIFDFPPVFFATLIGFGIARTIRTRWAVDSTTPSERVASSSP
jgi:hypothetical protein